MKISITYNTEDKSFTLYNSHRKIARVITDAISLYVRPNVYSPAYAPGAVIEKRVRDSSQMLLRKVFMLKPVTNYSEQEQHEPQEWRWCFTPEAIKAMQRAGAKSFTITYDYRVVTFKETE